MEFQNYLIDAVDVVLAWNIPVDDFAEDNFAEVVKSQACLMAGIHSDDANASYYN